MGSEMCIRDSTVIAIDGHVVNQSKVQRLLDTSENASVSVAVIRDGKLIHLDLPLMDAREDMAFFNINDADKFEKWLGRA